MSNLADIWLGDSAPLPQRGNSELRAMDTARLIDARPSWIVIQRDIGGKTVELAPQKVRLEIVQSIRDSGQQTDAMVSITKQYVVVIGYKDHPTIPDTDILRADLFFFDDRLWEIAPIINIIPGRLLASADLKP